MLKRHLILLALNFIMILSDKDFYGSYNLTVTDVELCRGPKPKDCSVMKVQIKNGSVIQYDINVTQSVVPAKGKMIILTNGKEYLRYQMKNPCEHFFLKPLFYSFFNMTKDCVILKGRYQFSADVQKLSHSYYGGSSVRGNYTLRSRFYSDECNFYCLVVKYHMF